MNLKKTAVVFLGLAALLSSTAYAATVDGTYSSGEYAYTAADTGTAYHNSTYFYGSSGSVIEENDANGGTIWELEQMGLDLDGSILNFGIKAGDILDGKYQQKYQSTYRLGHIGINVDNDDHLEYAIFYDTSASGWSSTYGWTQEGAISLKLYEVAEGGWKSKTVGSRHTDYYKAYSSSRTEIATLDGWFENGSFSNTETVLEGSLDLSLLSLFDLQSGGEISMYLTMSCVNDEIYSVAQIPSQVPVPAAVWLFGTAMMGLLGYCKTRKAQADA